MTLQNGTHGTDGQTDRQTDGQTDRQTDRVRRNMRPPPREEGRIIMTQPKANVSSHVHFYYYYISDTEASLICFISFVCLFICEQLHIKTTDQIMKILTEM